MSASKCSSNREYDTKWESPFLSKSPGRAAESLTKSRYSLHSLRRRLLILHYHKTKSNCNHGVNTTPWFLFWNGLWWALFSLWHGEFYHFITASFFCVVERGGVILNKNVDTCCVSLMMWGHSWWYREWRVVWIILFLFAEWLLLNNLDAAIIWGK